MENLKMILYWASYTYYVYVFGYASLFKVFQKSSMMQNMQALGFEKTPTIFIGIFELLGVILMVVGIFEPVFRNMALLCLFPFAIGAFVTHMAHKEYSHFYNALAMCILTIIMLWTDKNFRILL